MKKIRSKPASKASIEGNSQVADPGKTPLRCVTSISSATRCNSVSGGVECKKQSKKLPPSHNVKSRLPYGSVTYRVEAPHMKRIHSANSMRSVASQIAFNKDDSIETPERNNNTNECEPLRSNGDKMAASDKPISITIQEEI